MLMEISFPAPTPYDGDEGIPGPPGAAYQSVSELVVQRAFRGISSKKSPGPDGIGPLAIRCVYDWEPAAATQRPLPTTQYVILSK